LIDLFFAVFLPSQVQFVSDLVFLFSVCIFSCSCLLYVWFS